MAESKLIGEYFETGTLKGLPDKHFINGCFQPAVNGGLMETFDPGAARAFHSFAAGDADDVDKAVSVAKVAQVSWGRTRPAERGAILARAAGLIREQADRLAVIESLDSGKPLHEAIGDISGAARCFEYYAGAADKLQGESIPLDTDHLAYTIREPAGVTAHIIPWNFPLSTMARSVAPALAVGCSVIAKPAETTPITALMLADILHKSGIPEGVCNVVTGLGPTVGAPLTAHPDVRSITFTGSTPTGISVMKTAADNITSVVLELGGKSPLIVMADADMDNAVDGVLGAIYENAGQVCSAGSRLVVERSIHALLLEKLVARTKALSIGHGLQQPRIGPVNSESQLKKISHFVDDARVRGVEVVSGGHVTADPNTGQGWFFEPTILDNLSTEDKVIQEEIFGPVLSVQIVDDEEEAVSVANGTPFGLVAGIYTSDFGRAHRMARDIDAGQIYINEFFAGGIEVPFGGNKQSGFGREKGLVALQNYCKIKSVAARISRLDRQ